MQMAGKLCSLPALPVLLFACLSAISVRGQSASGFLNIDCGKPKSYSDEETGLFYVTDSGYVDGDAGEPHEIPSAVQTARFYVQSYDLRSFPNGTRNCYTLPAEKGNKYLLRAFFLYANYDGRNQTPKFELYLGTNHWLTVDLPDAFTSYNKEIIAVATADWFSVCLVNTGLGVPFISSLQLKTLKDNLYPQANSSRSLAIVRRHNYGSSNQSFLIRYPDDIYDRIWLRFPPEAGWASLTTARTVQSQNSYEPPSSVMRTAATPANGSSLNLSWTWPEANFGRPSSLVFYMHFAELQSLSENQTRRLNISVDGEHWAGPFSPSYLALDTMATPTPLVLYNFTVSVLEAEGSALPPFLNAMEVYAVRMMTNLTTHAGDIDTMRRIRALYRVKRNWTGDPCAPMSLVWGGLNCSYNNTSNQARIVSLSLSSVGLTGEIPDVIANLTQLEFLDLSNNSLDGTVPDFLASLPRLETLDLSSNNLSGSIPKELQERYESGVLKLSVENNPKLCTDPENCAKSEKKSRNVAVVVVPVVCAVVLLLAVVLIIFRKVSTSSTKTKKNKKPAGPGGDGGSGSSPFFHSENRHFTHSELVNITDNFSKSIGRGGFGEVYHGILENDVQVAVKLLSESSTQGVDEFQMEAKLLTRIHHRNLVSFVGYCNDSNHMALVYEYMAGGNLQGYLSGEASKTTRLFWKDRLRIAVESAQGLEYLHKGCKPAIVHRDVKSSNILLTEKLEARIADFGLSKMFQVDAATPLSTVVMGTPGYVDPEYYTTNRLNEKSDVYSFGVVILELITGLPAIVLKAGGNINLVRWVETRVATGQIAEIVDPSLRGEYDANSAWKAVEIALSCTSATSVQRPNMTEVVVLLKECFEPELPDVGSRNPLGRSIEVAPLNLSTASGPLPR